MPNPIGESRHRASGLYQITNDAPEKFTGTTNVQHDCAEQRYNTAVPSSVPPKNQVFLKSSLIRKQAEGLPS